MRNSWTELLAALACVGLSACASLGPPLPPSLELPRPPVDLRAARKGNKVTLTWTIPVRTEDRRSMRYLGKTQICRGLDPVLKQCGKPVAVTGPPAGVDVQKKPSTKKLTATFVDILPSEIEQEHLTGSATYAIEVLNSAGRGAGLSNQVHVPLVPTLPPFSGFSAKVTAQGVLITWECPSLGKGKAWIGYLLRIYRRPESGGSETRIAEVDVTECAIETAESGKTVTSFLDQSFEWQKTYFYRAAVVSAVAVSGKPRVEVEGDDTPEVKIFADDVFPPAIPTGLQAVFSGPGQQPFIDLIWSPDTDADLEGYNVYRREAGEEPVKLNSELVKAPAFRDMKVSSGRTYFYSVSAVDSRGNESARSEEASEKVP